MQLSFLRDLKHLVYPELCLCCGRELSIKETHICIMCSSELLYTNMLNFPDEENEIKKLFYGRIPLIEGYAHLRFLKKSSSQKILFNIKYRSQPQLATYFGNEIGSLISSKWQLNLPEVIIPVPLHHRKEFLRGYNQSAALAQGISETSHITADNNLVKRIKFTETQTKKSRFERWNNLSGVFHVSPKIKNYEHLLLVDDVSTTGSTIEQLYLVIKEKHPEVKISVITLAIA